MTFDIAVSFFEVDGSGAGEIIDARNHPDAPLNSCGCCWNALAVWGSNCLTITISNPTRASREVQGASFAPDGISSKIVAFLEHDDPCTPPHSGADPRKQPWCG